MTDPVNPADPIAPPSTSTLVTPDAGNTVKGNRVKPTTGHRRNGWVEKPSHPVWVLLLSVVALAGSALLLAFEGRSTAKVAIFAALLFLVALITIVACFKMLGLARRRSALGLPPGSVRAILALLFTGAFVGLSLYLLGQVDPTKSPSHFSHVPLEVVTQLGGNVSDITLDAKSDPATYSGTTVLEDTSRRELALQIFTASSTLVAAVSAFYFGSKAAGGDPAPPGGGTGSGGGADSDADPDSKKEPEAATQVA